MVYLEEIPDGVKEYNNVVRQGLNIFPSNSLEIGHRYVHTVEKDSSLRGSALHMQKRRLLLTHT